MKHILISLLPAVILLAVILALFTPCMNMVSESMNMICSASSTALDEEKGEIDDYETVPSFFNFEPQRQEVKKYTLSLAGNIFLIDVNLIMDTAKKISDKTLDVLKVSQEIGYLLY